MDSFENMKTTFIMEDSSVIFIETEYQDVISELTRDDNESKFYKIDDYMTINTDKILGIRRYNDRFTDSKHFLEEGFRR